MFGILKRTVSDKISGIVDSFSPSNHSKKDTPNKLKRTREEKIKDEHELQSDCLVTPPEKRLKQINQETGRSPSSSLSSFKEFIDLSKLLRNNFLWKYVVQGDREHRKELNEDNMEADVVKAIADTKERSRQPVSHIQPRNKDFLLASPSPWQFRKTEEPTVKVNHTQENKISKRRALNSVKGQSDDEQQPVKAIPIVEACTISDTEAFGAVETKNHVATELSTCAESDPCKELWGTTPLVQNKTSRMPSTVDTVIRLAERDRYRKLLARFTSCQSPITDSNDSVTRQNTLGTHRKPLDLDDSFPRLKDADSIVKKLQRSLSRTEASPSATSPGRVVPEYDTINTNHDFDLRQLSKSSQASAELKDTKRSFSGRNTANLSRIESRSAENDGLLGNSWTAKWRQILTQDEQDRQRKINKEERKLKDLSKKRKERELELLRKVDARRDLDKKKSKEKLPALTKEMEIVVSNSLTRGRPSDTLVEAFNMSITRHDITTLADSNWLNDEVVNFYFNLLHERSSKPGNLKMHFFNSFFYPKLLRTGYSGVRRWTKKVDIFSVDIVVLPVHLGMHWCLAAIDMRKKQIAYYDSLKGYNIQCIAALRNYIMEEHKDKKKGSLNINEWTETLPKDIPEQLNGCDCGVFACKYAECLTRDSELNFTQNDMPYFRRRMIHEIVTKRLL